VRKLLESGAEVKTKEETKEPKKKEKEKEKEEKGWESSFKKSLEKSKSRSKVRQLGKKSNSSTVDKKLNLAASYEEDPDAKVITEKKLKSFKEVKDKDNES